MKYGEIIAFEPIIKVVQLREADDKRVAARLISNYVISEGMEKNLNQVIIPQLDFHGPLGQIIDDDEANGKSLEHQGLLIVGYYGSGKSHLMSVISSIAEHEELLTHLKNPAVKREAEKIAGHFKVIRIEIGAVRRSLRDIVCTELEKGLKSMGIGFSFPPADKITNHKDEFIRMMGEFQKKYPDKGLLLVVDELLDFLRTRAEGDLIYDLNFLREVGESIRWSRFRFMTGIQEALFNNPRFEFVAASIQLVKPRYIQIRIVKEDLKFVISERLLKKDAKQKAKIRNHLRKFSSLYGDMNERLEDYVTLYPVHPAYLDILERLTLVEKREVLKAISSDIEALIDEKVPDNDPGLLSFDRYWNTLNSDASIVTNTDVKDVLEKGKILESIIQRQFQKVQYRPTAVRIIQALAIHRLTTGDVTKPVGLTSENLRDELCLCLELPEKDSEFLRSTIETILRDISRTVSGQFISQNEENGQYYLDLKKDIDYDKKIEERGEALGEHLDRYYFDALKRVLKTRDETYVSGHRIWQHDIVWKEHKAGRSGYLFFGAPNERPTAQPPRDFYIYFIQPFDTPEFEDEKKPDEVFFHFVERAPEFDKALRLYAGAREMGGTSGGPSKRIYEDKAMEFLKIMERWLREHMVKAYEVTYLGERKKLIEWMKKAAVPSNADIPDTVEAVAGLCLAPHFAEIAPHYPKFSDIIRNQEDREEVVKDALKWLRGSLKTKRGGIVLDGLKLLDGDQITVDKSPYAQHILKLMSSQGEGQVLNRADIFESVYGIDYDRKFHLEPELMMVVISALVYHGDVVISYPGKKIDPTNFEELTKMGIEDLKSFKHIEYPKSTPIETLEELFKVLDLTPGLVKSKEYLGEAIKSLQTNVEKRLKQIVELEQKLNQRYVFWNVELVSDQQRGVLKEKIAAAKQFLESLQRYNTEGKLKNFVHTKKDVHKFRDNLESVSGFEQVLKFTTDFTPILSYISEAEAILPQDNAVRKTIDEAKTRISPALIDAAKWMDREFRQDLLSELERLKREYIAEYFNLHGNARLGVNEDELKKKLMHDPRLAQLTSLASIEILPKRQLTEFQTQLNAFTPCYNLTEQDLMNSPVCPYCRYRPLEQITTIPVANSLAELEDRLDTINGDWTRTLLTNLNDPVVKKNIKQLLKADQQEMIQEFIATKQLPEDLSSTFIRSLQDLYSGLEKVSVTVDDLNQALLEKGTPCTVDELEKRFADYIVALTKGRERKKIRIVIE
jgi:energy-coupling factor transporter ATP-binding protein EcfA2